MTHVKNIDTLKIDVAALDIVPEAVARENSALPVSVDRDGLRIIIPAGQLYETTVERLNFILNTRLFVDTAERDALDVAIDFVYSAMYSEIDNCEPRFQFKCPKHWYDLTETDDPKVRYCHECDNDVFLCRNDNELRERARNGQCVALAKEYKGLEMMGLIDFGADDVENCP